MHPAPRCLGVPGAGCGCLGVGLHRTVLVRRKTVSAAPPAVETTRGEFLWVGAGDGGECEVAVEIVTLGSGGVALEILTLGLGGVGMEILTLGLGLTAKLRALAHAPPLTVAFGRSPAELVSERPKATVSGGARARGAGRTGRARGARGTG